MYGVFNKPVSAVESTVYITAIFKQHALRILHKYLPLYRDADRRNMLAQVRQAQNNDLLMPTLMYMTAAIYTFFMKGQKAVYGQVIHQGILFIK